MKNKPNKIKTIVIPVLIIFILVGGLGLAIEEFVVSNGEFRTTLWDGMNGRGEIPKGRAEVSQQVAIQICKQQALQHFGRNLLLGKFDQRSSRYNKDLKVHTIFVDLTVKEKEREPIYIRCDISAVNRMIIESRVKGMVGFSLFGK